jgi:hypothetical protein
MPVKGHDNAARFFSLPDPTKFCAPLAEMLYTPQVAEGRKRIMAKSVVVYTQPG